MNITFGVGDRLYSCRNNARKHSFFMRMTMGRFYVAVFPGLQRHGACSLVDSHRRRNDSFIREKQITEGGNAPIRNVTGCYYCHFIVRAKAEIFPVLYNYEDYSHYSRTSSCVKIRK